MATESGGSTKAALLASETGSRRAVTFLSMQTWRASSLTSRGLVGYQVFPHRLSDCMSSTSPCFCSHALPPVISLEHKASFIKQDIMRITQAINQLRFGGVAPLLGMHFGTAYQASSVQSSKFVARC